MANNKVISNINADKALANILSNFESDYILHIITDSLDMKFRPYSNTLPGIYSIESNFTYLLSNIEDPSKHQDILEVREQTYLEIIDIVCKYYNISFNPPENTDIYSAAYWIYRFFVSDFTNTLINFYVNYILQEKDELYLYLNLDSYKKDKDSTTIYSKKVCPDEKLSIIHANIELVLDAISSFDIGFENLVRFSQGNNEQLITFLLSSISDNTDVFKFYFASYLQSHKYRSDVITCVKLGIQQRISGGVFTDPSNIIRQD